MHFGRFERARYKKYIVPVYANFLKNCYCAFRFFLLLPPLTNVLRPIAVDECRARALPDNSGFESLYTMEREEGEVEIDTIDNGLTTTVGSITSRSVSSAPSVAASEITSTSIAPSGAAPNNTPASIAPSVAAPSTSNHTSAAPSKTSALSRGKAAQKRVPPSKKATTSAVKPVPKGPSDASSAPGPSQRAPGIPGIPELAAATDSGNNKEPGRNDGLGGDQGGNDAGGKNAGGDDEGGRNRVGDGEGGPDNNDGEGHQDNRGGGGQDNEGGGDDGCSPASPMSGLHPMFDLPPSPLFSSGDLPPSRFGSREPDVTQAALSSSSSVPSTNQPTMGPPSSIPIAVAGLNRPTIESPSVARKRDRPDDGGAPEDVGPSTRAKRARNSNSETIAPVPTAQNKAKKAASSRKSATMTKTSPTTTISDPSWLTSATSMLKAEELGGIWSSLVQAWLAFERKESKQTPSILNSTHRPVVVRDWIQRTRSASYRPAIESTLEFEKAYMSWWKELQPDWRMSSSRQIAYSKVDGDWDGIRTAGRNGLLSVVAALFFWGVALKKTKKTAYEDKGWKLGTDDCLRVLNGLLKE